MRCLNCGWDNDSHAIRCLKCNISLEGTMGAGLQPTDSYGTQSAHLESGEVAGTIQSDPVELPAWDGGPSTSPRPDSGSRHCDCGYPVTADAMVCPRCQRALNHAKEDLSTIVAKIPGNFHGTIDPFRESANRVTCSLKPIERQSEPERQAIAFNQENVVLNRDVVDPGNPTITGKVQARLLFENGAWFLEDQSEVQTTFLQAGRRLAIQDGDIILMGDRKFIFKADTKKG